MCEIDTDKIAGELESTWTGVVRALVVDVNESVPVGGTIAVVAPADVPQEDIDAVVAEARAQLESGAIEDDSGPKVLTVDVDGRQLSYAVLGDTESGNDPVLFVHGYGGDKNSWLFVQEPIAADRVTYALDLPGHGASSKDVGDGTIQTLAQAVLGFLDAVGVNRVHLVGHSMGGAVVTAAGGRSGRRRQGRLADAHLAGRFRTRDQRRLSARVRRSGVAAGTETAPACSCSPIRDWSTGSSSTICSSTSASTAWIRHSDRSSRTSSRGTSPPST